MAEPMPEPLAEEGTHPDPEADLLSDAELTFESAPEAEPILEMLDEAVVETEFVMAEVEMEETLVLEESAPETPPFWPPQASEEPSEEMPPEPAPMFTPAPELTPESLLAQTNSLVAEGETEPKSLEDSGRDMLRPMLRQWLDENMPRIIREELDSDALQRGQD